MVNKPNQTIFLLLVLKKHSQPM